MYNIFLSDSKGFYDGGGYVVDFPTNASEVGIALLDQLYVSISFR